MRAAPEGEDCEASVGVFFREGASECFEGRDDTWILHVRRHVNTFHAMSLFLVEVVYYPRRTPSWLVPSLIYFCPKHPQLYHR